MTLVDANVLLDIFTRDSRWLDWSQARLRDASLRGALLINDVIYAETSARYRDMRDFERALTNVGVVVAHVPRDALFLAGKAFVNTAQRVAIVPVSCRISLSALMRRRSISRFSLATSAAIAIIFPLWN
jgi:predicted nucleic acid-binding protein